MWLLIFETEIGSAAAPPGKLTRCAAQAQPPSDIPQATLF
jgi:hypothetical protein